MEFDRRTSAVAQIGAILVAIVVFASGCSCESDCTDEFCYRNTEVVLREPIGRLGVYRIEATPAPAGTRVDCETEIVEGVGGVAERTISCDTVSFLLSSGDADAGEPVVATGLAFPGHLESMTLRITRDSEVLYDGTATLESVREYPTACDPDSCRVPVLQAR